MLGSINPYIGTAFTIINTICIFLKNKVRLIKNLNFDIKINKLKNSKNSLSVKLQELNTLKEQGLITKEDYNNKKINYTYLLLYFSVGFCVSLGISQYCPYLNTPSILPSSQYICTRLGEMPHSSAQSLTLLCLCEIISQSIL